MGFYEEILDLFENERRDTGLFLDWALNFRYNDEEPSITIHYEPTEELADLFDQGFEELEDVTIFLDQVYGFRLKNDLDWHLIRTMGSFALPDLSTCDESEESMAMDLYDEIMQADEVNFKFAIQEAFLIEVLDWLSEEVDFDD